jgi:glycosyltransferase involved in cell wall biosynthesis
MIMSQRPRFQFIDRIDLSHPNDIAECGVSEAKQPPLVSVCVTAHNYARYLPACLESILRQSYQPVECIVVDDGSTDGTDEVLKRYRAGIQVVRHETPRGQLAAIISAFARARGQFVCFIDADDFIYRNYVSVNVAAHLSAETYAAVSTSLQDVIDAEDRGFATYPAKVFQPLLRLPEGSFRQRVIDFPGTGPVPVMLYDPQANYACQWLWGTMSSMMFRHDAVALVLSGEPKGFRICADAYLAQFCHALGGTIMIELTLSAYRRHGRNNFADNVVLGGLAPMSTRSGLENDPRATIASQIFAKQQEFVRAIGIRRFVPLIEKFCPLPQAFAILLNRENGLGAKMYAWFLLQWVARHLRVVIFRASRIIAMLRLSETA